MVQEMNILRCYSCQIFQVHIVKKANKWQCKICNEKQSIQHIYYQGSGQDCRLQVQHLNFMKHVKEQQESERLEPTELEPTEFVGLKRKSLDKVIEKPVISNSKWAKYKVPKKEYVEKVSNDDEGIDLSSHRKKNCCNCPNTHQDDITLDENFGNGKLIDAEEIDKASSSFRKNLSQNLTAADEGNDLPLLKKSYLLCTNSVSYTEDDKPSSSRDYGCNSIEKNQSIVIIRKYMKRKSDSENIGPRSEPNSSGSESADMTLKRSKLVDVTPIRKRSLRDIVESNRSNAVKSLEKTADKRFELANSKSVLKETNNSLNININVNETEILKPNVRRKTIFETDCDDLDDILDF